jgi:hypothetical protein
MPDVSNTKKEINIASADTLPELHGSLDNRGRSPLDLMFPLSLRFRILVSSSLHVKE